MSEGAAKTRSDRIDALKFFAIALVVLGHVVDLSRYGGHLEPVLYVIRTVNMPLFMFLAGYVLFGREGTSPVAFVRRKFLALIVPYFAWIGLDLVRSASPLSKWVPALAGAVVDPQVQGRKWFLYVLFVFYVLFTLVRLASDRDIALKIAAALTVGLTFLPEGEYFGRFNVQWLFTFFVAGYLIAKHRSRVPRVDRVAAVATTGVFAVLLATGWRPDGGAGWPPWFFSYLTGLFAAWRSSATPVFLLWKYATAFAGIAATVSLYSLIDVRLLRAQAVAGRRSLGIYVTQGWLLVLAVGSGALGAFVSSALVLVASLAVTMLLEKPTITRVLFLGMPGRAKQSPAEIEARPAA